ncbi:MAG: cadherin-like domain-containing protein, partial [Leptothrix sp. (in: b-proteobacteria)]
MATSTTLIAGKTLALNAAQTTDVGSAFTLQSLTNRFVGDFNGDGKLDIIAEDGTSTAMVMLGNGDGTFGAAQTATYATAASLFLASDPNGQLSPGSWNPDINGDTLSDSITYTPSSTTISVGFGTLAAQTYTVGHAILDTALADVSGDGIYDLVLANADNTISVLQFIDPAGTAVKTNEDTATAITLAGYNTTGTNLTSFKLSALPANGTVYLDAGLTQAVTTATAITATSNEATVYFKPTLNWNGSTSVQYVAVDAAGNTSATPATQAITVAPVNDAPALTSTAATLAAGTEDTAYTVTAAQLLTGWTDVDSASITVAGNTVTADHGTVTYNAATSSYTVTPTLNYN